MPTTLFKYLSIRKLTWLTSLSAFDSALRHGRRSTAQKKVALVYAQLNPNTTEIVFQNTTELVDFIDGMDGCGLLTRGSKLGAFLNSHTLLEYQPTKPQLISAQSASAVSALLPSVSDVLDCVPKSTHPRAEVFHFQTMRARRGPIGCWMLPYLISPHAHPLFSKLDKNQLR
jgi:hypothetical protein